MHVTAYSRRRVKRVWGAAVGMLITHARPSDTSMKPSGVLPAPRGALSSQRRAGAPPVLVVAPVNSSGFMRPAGVVRAGRAA